MRFTNNIHKYATADIIFRFIFYRFYPKICSKYIAINILNFCLYLKLADVARIAGRVL